MGTTGAAGTRGEAAATATATAIDVIGGARTTGAAAKATATAATAGLERKPDARRATGTTAVRTGTSARPHATVAAIAARTATASTAGNAGPRVIGRTTAAATATAVAAAAAARILSGAAATAAQPAATATAGCAAGGCSAAAIAAGRAVVGKTDIADRGVAGIDEDRTAGAESATTPASTAAALGIAADQRDVLDRRRAVEEEDPVVALRVDRVAVAVDGDVGRDRRQQRRAECNVVLQQDAIARRSARDGRGQLRCIGHQDVAGGGRRRPDRRKGQRDDKGCRCEPRHPQPLLANQSPHDHHDHNAPSPSRDMDQPPRSSMRNRLQPGKSRALYFHLTGREQRPEIAGDGVLKISEISTSTPFSVVFCCI